MGLSKNRKNVAVAAARKRQEKVLTILLSTFPVFSYLPFFSPWPEISVFNESEFCKWEWLSFEKEGHPASISSHLDFLLSVPERGSRCFSAANIDNFKLGRRRLKRLGVEEVSTFLLLPVAYFHFNCKILFSRFLRKKKKKKSFVLAN